MNVSFCTGDPDSYCHIATSNSTNRSYFCKLNFLLCLRHLKQSLLPLVVGLLADAILPTPDFDILAAVAAF